MHISSLSTIPLICLLCHISNVYSSGIIRQNFTSSSEVVLLLTPIQSPNRDQIFRKPIYVPLYANRTKQLDFAIPRYNETFSFQIQIINSAVQSAIGAKFDRSISLKNDEEWVNDTFSMQGVSIHIQTSFVCSENHFGPNCELKCDQKEVSRSGRKRCDKMGKIRCDYGWMGPHCSQAVDPRKCGCHNEGVCVSSAVHTLAGPFSTSEQLVCECQSGFVGDKCEIAMIRGKIAKKSRSCDSKDICLNGAQCLSNGPTSFCACPPAFRGLLCEIPTSVDIPSVAAQSAYSTTLYIITGIVIFILIIAACITYKFKPNRSNALTRLQPILPFETPNTCQKSLLVDAGCKEGSKVFSIDAAVLQNHKNEQYERYTAAPNSTSVRSENDYAVINKPQPPTKMPPPVPILP